MNTNCPECDAAYNITEAHIGRKLTCKSCSTPLIVTERGLERKNAAAAPPASGAAEFAFENRDEDRGRSRSRDRDDDANDSPRRSRKSRRSRDDDDDDARDSGRRSRRSSRQGSSELGEYLAFRKMIVPLIIQIIFWVLAGAVSIFGFVFAVISLISGTTEGMLTGIAILFIGVPIYILVIRVYCEVLIVLFRMNATLTEIKTVIERQSPPPSP